MGLPPGIVDRLFRFGLGVYLVRACWLRDLDKGGVQDYVESATSIETYPAIAPWEGQTPVYRRTNTYGGGVR